MFGIGSAEKKKKSVFDKAGRDVNFGVFRRNQKDDSKKRFDKQTVVSCLSDNPKEIVDGLSEKDEPDKVVSMRFSVSLGKAECLFPILMATIFIWAGFWISDSNESELEAGRTKVVQKEMDLLEAGRAKAAQKEIEVNAKILKVYKAKNPKEPLPESLELLSATELGIVVVDPWGNPYVYDKKNHLLRCIVRNSDGTVKYEIARRF